MKIHAASLSRRLCRPKSGTPNWALLLTFLAFAVTATGQSFQPAYDLQKAPGSAADAQDLLAYGGASLDGFGRTVRTGDINGDGVSDVIVGATGADVGLPVRSDAGAVFVWFGKTALGGIKDVAGAAGPAPDLTIWGASATDQVTAGGALMVADVNGDGISDLLLGTSFGDGAANGRSNSGEAYVVLGRTTFPATLDLAIQGDGGADVTIFGASADDNLTSSGGLKAADVNGDGFSDLLIGAPLGDGPAESRLSSGEAYIVFGRASFPVALDLSVADVTIYGATASDFLTLGGSVAAGDVNGDGMADLLLGATGGDGPAEARSSAGEAYVILGRASFPATLSLEVNADVTVWGGSANDQLTSGAALAARDLDGDGIADLVLGASGGDGPADGRSGAGEAYVVRGRAALPATLDLGISGSTGADLTIYGATASDSLTSGGALAFGDINRDGLTDLVLGAPLADGPAETRSSAGEIYIVLGRTLLAAVLDLSLPGPAGADATVYGATAGDNLGIGRTLTVADVNGDQFADLILGAPLADGPAETRASAGEAYMVRGRGILPPVLDLALPGNLGANITLHGATANDQLTSGGALAAADVNGDGLNDILLGAGNGDGPADALSNSGELSILHGIASPEIELTQPATADIADGGSKDFGNVGVDGTKRLVFTIKNTGAANLSGLSLAMDGADAGLFAITRHPEAVVLPGGNTTFTVAFTAPDLGTKEAVLHIANNDDDESPYDITLTATGVIPVPPLVETLAVDSLDTYSATLKGTVDAAGSEREVTFEYGTTTAYGTTETADPALVDGNGVTPVSAALTGLLPRTLYHYRVRASGDLGASAGEDMTFVTPNRPPLPAPDYVSVLPGATVTLDVLANDVDPDGDALQLASFTKPLPAKDGKLVRVGNALVFTASHKFKKATFKYTVDDGFGGRASANVYLTLGTCSINPTKASVAAAGGTYPITVTATGAWSVHERPSWITASPDSGTGNGTVMVTVAPHTHKNSRTQRICIGGKLHTITQSGARHRHDHHDDDHDDDDGDWYPHSLPDGLTGTYHGLVERHSSLNNNLGSRLELTTTSKGAFSAKLTTGGDSKSLCGTLVAHPELPIWQARIPLSGNRIALELTVEEGDASLTGRITDGAATSAALEGWRNAWDARTNRATEYGALYDFTLDQPDPNPLLPQGSGCGLFTVQESSGSVILIGKLSDHTIFTGSTFVGQEGQVLMYQALDSVNGSFAGALSVTLGATVSGNTLEGAASWYAPKTIPATKKTTYRPGFGPIPLSATGGVCLTP